MHGPGQLKQIRSEVRDHTAVITLAHASRRNAINAEMVTEIVGVLDEIEASPEVSAVVIMGEGRAAPGARADQAVDQGSADVSSYADAVELELPRQLWSAQQGEFAARLAKLGVGQARKG